MTDKRTQIADEGEQTFPFGIEFQAALLKLLTLDVGFASAALPYLKDTYFENDVYAWGFRFFEQYKERYNAFPSLGVIRNETRVLEDPDMREYYDLTLESVENANLAQEDWLKDKTIEFIKRNIFVSGVKSIVDLYNTGKVEESIDEMLGVYDKIEKTAWSPPDREFFFENFDQRMSDRLSKGVFSDVISTGIPELDKVLGGGLSLGELGIWVAYPKCGKSTILVNHGVQAVRRGNRRVLHVVLEGSRQMVANRYDAVFAQEDYMSVKQGYFTEQAITTMKHDYQMYSDKLVLCGLTERWDYSPVDIHNELKELKRQYNWVPELIIVDYGDLLGGREKHYRNETDRQRAAFRDLKTLANKGYAVWTASQARRPEKDIDTVEEILTSRKIAECYDKVRVADFIGSINQTAAERQANQMRLFAELYRDNEAGKVFNVKADFSRMTITGLHSGGNDQPMDGAIFAPTPLGYTPHAQLAKTMMVQQRKAAI